MCIICSGTRNMEVDVRSCCSTSFDTNHSDDYAPRITPLAIPKGSIIDTFLNCACNLIFLFKICIFTCLFFMLTNREKKKKLKKF